MRNLPERAARRFVAIGLTLQALGAGGLAWLMAWQSRHEDGLGEVTKYTVRLAWHDALHQWHLFGLVVACVAVYVLGAVVVAWPFLTSRVELFVAVPAAALVGMIVLGLFIVAIGIALALVWVTDGDAFDVAFDGAHKAMSGIRRALHASTRLIHRRTR